MRQRASPYSVSSQPPMDLGTRWAGSIAVRFPQTTHGTPATLARWLGDAAIRAPDDVARNGAPRASGVRRVSGVVRVSVDVRFRRRLGSDVRRCNPIG